VIIVADTGPLISLAVIDKLELLDSLFTGLAIPETVWRELEKNIEKMSIPKASRFKSNIVSLQNSLYITAGLDLGEKEAIQLLEEIHADELLIDDNDGRVYAESRGILCTGTLGVLTEAKSEGLIPLLKPVFEELLIKRRFFALPLLNAILVDNDETPLSP
jgi:predicted nucleic acid-binding protein